MRTDRILLSVFVITGVVMMGMGCSSEDREADRRYLAKMEERIGSLNEKVEQLHAMAGSDTTEMGENARRTVAKIQKGLTALQSRIDSMRETQEELTDESKLKLEDEIVGLEATYQRSTRAMRK